MFPTRKKIKIKIKKLHTQNSVYLFSFIFYDDKIRFCDSLSKRFTTQKYYRGSIGESIVLVRGIPSVQCLSARDIIPFYLCATRNADAHFTNELRVNLTHTFVTQNVAKLDVKL